MQFLNEIYTAKENRPPKVPMDIFVDLSKALDTISHEIFLYKLENIKIRFDFIECFTTTFLRAHSWLNWVYEDDDEDEVGLKEKPEDTRYIKKITSK